MRRDQRVPPPDNRSYYLDGDCIGVTSLYHPKCLPPNLFHQFAGSLPAGQSPAATSLGNEHGVSGGLSPYKRKRLSRRVRYKRTAQRRAAESAAREERQREKTQRLTAHDTLKRGGTLGLCSCPTTELAMRDIAEKYGQTHTPSSFSFVTENGYCGYCGKWNWKVFREACGEAALESAIAELDLYHREQMHRVIAAA